MALKIRLRRMGRKKAPHYRIVIAESSMPRDGRFVATIGHYNPTTQPATLKVDRDKALAWMAKGAVATDTVQSLLKKAGVFSAEPTSVETAVSAVTGVAGKAAGAVKNAASKAASAVAGAASSVAETVAASSVVETVTEAVSGAASSVAETVSDAAGSVIDRVKDLAGSVSDAVTGGSDAAEAEAPAAEASAEETPAADAPAATEGDASAAEDEQA